MPICYLQLHRKHLHVKTWVIFHICARWNSCFLHLTAIETDWKKLIIFFTVLAPVQTSYAYPESGLLNSRHVG